MATTVERPLRRDAERNRQRILDAARELFTERGLSVTLNDIAHHAGCGVGTVYRRFPDKELLIDALFEERIDQLVAIAQECLGQQDAWVALSEFVERALTAFAHDRGLKELLLSSAQDCGRARVAAARERLMPLVGELVGRAHAAGVLRDDVVQQDLPMLQVMLSAVIEGSADVQPELWRRYLALALRGMRAEPSRPEPLPCPPLDDGSLETVLSSLSPMRHR